MDKKKICPFMTSAFQYDDHATDHGQIQYCIERLCMAWGIDRNCCKLIDKEKDNG